jgi:hypothetical protein
LTVASRERDRSLSSSFTYQAYASLEDLINQNARELNLISACLGSRFSALFVEQSISGYVQ